MTLTHEVKPGETLGSIASIYGTSPDVIHDLNRHHIGSGTLHAGQRIQVG